MPATKNAPAKRRGKAPRKTPVKKTSKKIPTKGSKIVTPVVPETPVETPLETPSGRTRRIVTPESVEDSFAALINDITSEISRQRENKTAETVANTRVLRQFLKQIRQLKGDSQRMAKKTRKPRKQTEPSGFLQKIEISDEMADFIGVEHGTRLNSPECSSMLHKYIVANNLQNPKDRRHIIPDEALTKLLNYDSRPEEEGGHGKLYYYGIQRLIQPHFIKNVS